MTVSWCAPWPTSATWRAPGSLSSTTSTCTSSGRGSSSAETIRSGMQPPGRTNTRGQRRPRSGRSSVCRAAPIPRSWPASIRIEAGQDRLGRDNSPVNTEWLKAVSEQLVNWTVGPSPSPVWASVVHPDLEPDAALELLWSEVERVCRLDEQDPVSSWEQRMGDMVATAGRINDLHFDALHFQGPDTDLEVGLLPSSRFISGGSETADGIPHRPNVPSEEAFTTPDPTRVDGEVRATRPLGIGGTVMTGLRVRFKDGRAVAIDADEGAEVLRARTAIDDGGVRLGEVALVDGESRIGQLGTVFYETLLDENAACHIALGQGFDYCVSG